MCISPFQAYQAVATPNRLYPMVVRDPDIEGNGFVGHIIVGRSSHEEHMEKMLAGLTVQPGDFEIVIKSSHCETYEEAADAVCMILEHCINVVGIPGFWAPVPNPYGMPVKPDTILDRKLIKRVKKHLLSSPVKDLMCLI